MKPSFLFLLLTLMANSIMLAQCPTHGGSIDGPDLLVGPCDSITIENTLAGNGDSYMWRAIHADSIFDVPVNQWPIITDSTNLTITKYEICEPTAFVRVNYAQDSTTCDTMYSNVQVVNFLVLPVELVSFSARVLDDNGMVLLQWNTAAEWNSSHFIVERSEDSWNWEDVGLVYTEDSPTGAKYTWTEAQIPVNKAYYRLKMVDIDGSYAYSSIQVVDLMNAALVNAIRIQEGNLIPAGSEIVLFSEYSQNERVTFRMVHVSKATTVAQGNLEETMSLLIPAPGIYYLFAETDSGVVGEPLKISAY